MKPIALVLGLAIAGCSVSASQDIDPGALSGSVSGHVWTFQAGDTNAFLSEGQDSFFAALYPQAYAPCSSAEPTGPHLIVAIPKTAGDFDMNLSRNMTFVTNGDQNLIATDGRIVVDQVTSTHVTGGLHGTYDGDNEVSGQFDVTVCSQ
jgi:hypothetical protein